MDDEYLGAKMQGCGISEGACLTDEKEEPAESKTLRQTEKTVDPRRGFRQRGPRDDRALATAIFFPFLVWGGFVFLPFDAPLLDGAPLRMLYVLRCSVFAATPVILGWLAMGVRRVRFGIVRPLLDDMEAAALEDLGVHAKYTRDSVSLFLMYFLQLVIMAMYLSQEQLKLVPLLAIVFALGRSVYWVAAAFGSSVRAFGSGLSFLPGLVMAVANLVFIFNVESSALFFSSPRHPQTLSPVGKQRFWG
ncbi:transmembrane protein 79-like isoform X3 [Phycodurus eques]|uniref:transmembrane protein 79-like isoform X3 n=1 Tax=Phycodurus eques TaxID=693459 RepID=UPI002ACD5226|nr:transmembrane protein 79-like isoform X3 [Phycodurus eques]